MSNDERMTNDETELRDGAGCPLRRLRNQTKKRSGLHHSGFVILSSLDIRHSSFRPKWRQRRSYFRGFEETFKLPDPGRMAHFAEGLGLDLADAFAGDLELPAYLFERPAVAVHQAKPLLQDLALPLGERLEDVFDLLLQEHDRGHVTRVFRSLILDEIAKAGVIAVTDRRLQGNRLLRHLQNGANPINGQLNLFGYFLGTRFAAVLLDKLFLDPHQLV